MFGWAHPADTGRCTLADVAQETWAPRAHCTSIDPVTATAHWERLEQRIHRLADRPRTRIRAEVPRVRDATIASDQHAWHRVTQSDREVGVRLIVFVLHVERWIELFDPRELELQRLELVGDDRPLDTARRCHHASGAVSERTQRREVVGEARTEDLCLADVQHPTRRIAKSVHPRRLGNLARLRAPGSIVGHGSALSSLVSRPAPRARTSREGKTRCGSR